MQNCDLDVLGAEAAGKVRPRGAEEDIDDIKSAAPSTDGSLREPAQGEKIDRRTLRRKFGEEVWALAEPEYMAGASALEISAKYGMSVQTVYLRFAGRGKRAREREEKRAKAERLEAAVAAAGVSDLKPDRRDTMRFFGRLFHEVGTRCEAEADAETEAYETGACEGGHVTELGVAELGVAELGAADAGGAQAGEPPKRRIVIRRHHGKETWAKARRDYEVGGYTVPAIAERYGIKEATVRKRASKEGWRKTVDPDVQPLKPPDDPAQVETGEGGEVKSAWARIAHPAQLPPEGDWDTWLFQGGRGAGKTRAGAEWIAELAEATPRGLFALVGATENDVRSVMIEGPSGLLSLPGRKPIHYESSLKRVTWRHNGAIARIFSAEEPERLRGPQFMGAWADEFCAWPRPDYVLKMLRLGLRLDMPDGAGAGRKPRLAVTTTPRPIAAFRELRGEASCVLTTAPTEANAKNLHGGFLAGLAALYGGTSLERQELLGELVEGDGALWKAAQFERARGERPDKLERVVVAVDPPATVEGVCGIVAAGLSGDRGFVLEDASLAGASPTGWARRVRETAEKWAARKIVVESNQGGDMVRTILKMEGVTCRVESVHAVEGKRARAEPVAALYEKDRVTHCGVFRKLEDELLGLGCGREGKSRDRLDRADALVWALTDLLVNRKPLPGVIDLWA